MLDSGLNEQQQVLAENALRSGEVLLRVVNEILDFSKIEAGKVELEVTDYDLRNQIDAAIAVMLPEANCKSLEVIVSDLSDLPRYAKGDPARVTQIRLNLLGNAIKFTERGRIDVRVSLLPGPLTLIDMRIIDTGIGIAEDQASQLFQTFVQGDSSIQRRYGGTGLGLAISRKLVEAMGGQNLTDLALMAHSLSTTAKILGLQRLRRLVWQVEQSVDTGLPAGLLVEARDTAVRAKDWLRDQSKDSVTGAERFRD